MLYKNTVAQSILDLIKLLCKSNCLNDFFLVGGTALSLQIGHRVSIDLDFFSASSFDVQALDDELSNTFSFKKLFLEKNTIKGTIDGVFIDIMSHRYPLIEPLLIEDNMRMAGLTEISAMKLNAIIGSGQRLKDFVDIAYLSSFVSLNTMISAYKSKYGNISEIIILKALIFFDEIDFDVEIDMAGKSFHWEKIAKRLELMCGNPDKVFPYL